MKVIVIYGSPNDKPFMEPAREYFAQENVPYEETVLSAHRDLPELIRFLGDLEASGEKAVILAVAGLSAALPGVVVMSCSLPVIGVPDPGGPLSGLAALLAIAQCPGGVPCTTVGLLLHWNSYWTVREFPVRLSAWPTALWPVSPENLSPSSACSARGM